MVSASATLNPEFGNLLTQGLRSIAARENRTMKPLLDELAFEMSRTYSSVEKWRQGRLPPSSRQVELLARVCVQRGGMDKSWLARFLTQSRYPDREALMRELFPGEETMEQANITIQHNLPRGSYERFIGRK